MSIMAITSYAGAHPWRSSQSSSPCCVGPASALSAQQAASPAPQKEITIEELFLQSVEFQILREKAFSGDYDIKMSALDDLEKKVNDGSYKGNDQQVEFVLEYLAMEGSARTTREAGRLVNNFPEVRRRAANLLGRVGTDGRQERPRARASHRRGTRREGRGGLRSRRDRHERQQRGRAGAVVHVQQGRRLRSRTTTSAMRSAWPSRSSARSPAASRTPWPTRCWSRSPGETTCAR